VDKPKEKRLDAGVIGFWVAEAEKRVEASVTDGDMAVSVASKQVQQMLDSATRRFLAPLLNHRRIGIRSPKIEI
jgi:hypothetical protein